MPNGIEPLLSSNLAILQVASLASIASEMTVTVLLFASYADTLGASQLSFELAGGSTVSDVLGRVRALPGAERLPHEPLVAVNERYARSDQQLAPGDEVAIIPPVAGG
jgi:molybdopterin converting factor small subunit